MRQVMMVAVLLALACATSGAFAADDPFQGIDPEQACTVIYASDGVSCFGGNNEDYLNPLTKMWFMPGEDDGFGGVDSGRRLAARLQDAELEAMPAAGHLSWLDDPASAARSVSAFLRRNRASGVEPTPSAVAA